MQMLFSVLLTLRSYELGDPDMRYGPFDGISEISQLDVWSWRNEDKRRSAVL